jgi:hypothetical protein
MRRVLVVMCLVFTAPEIATGVTGNEWRELSEPMRFGYVVGVSESVQFLRLFDRQAPSALPVDNPSSRLIALLDRCAWKRMTSEPVVEIVDRYVNDHPAEWHYQMPELVLSALRAACSP